MKKLIKRKGSEKNIRKNNSRREKGATKRRKKKGRAAKKSKNIKKSGEGEKRDKNKNKKTRKRKMHTRARNAGRQTQNSTISCLQDSILYTKFLKDNVINFLRRKTRLAASNKQTSNKANKKGEFKEPAARLIQVKRRPQ